MSNLVSLKYLDSYDVSKVERAVRESFANIGLFDVIRPKMKVMLKICLPYSVNPDTAEITHPAILRGIVNVLNEMGVNCVIADSPFGKYSLNNLDGIYLDTGMLEVANLTKCELNRNMKVQTVDLEEGVKTKCLTLLDEIKKVDAIINISKIKVDENLGLVSSTANLFGLVPGEEKTLILNQLTTVSDFNEYICDLTLALKDKLKFNIVDGVVALEDEKTQHMLSVLIAGENTFSVDSVVAKIVNKDINDTICLTASKRNLFNINSPFEIVGDDIKEFISPDFKLNRVSLNSKIHKSAFKRKQYFDFHQERTYIPQSKCKGCSVCSKVCPTGAIMMKYDKNGELYANIDYSKCIFCNRCHEACPYSVIEKITPHGYTRLKNSIQGTKKSKSKNAKKS